MRTDPKTRKRFAEMLPIIRSIVGLTSEKLAELLDISRSTVSNIECHPEKMSTVMYLAIRGMVSFDPVARMAIDDAESDFFTEEELEQIHTAFNDARKRIGTKNGIEAIRRATRCIYTKARSCARKNQEFPARLIFTDEQIAKIIKAGQTLDKDIRYPWSREKENQL